MAIFQGEQFVIRSSLLRAASLLTEYFYGDPRRIHRARPAGASMTYRTIRSCWSIANARQVIGYAPQDDSERVFADDIARFVTSNGRTAA
jgi:hypothetical protein